MLPISVCMIVKNEEEILATALASVQGRVMQVIVGDTGSTDGSKTVAEALGATVIDVAWQDDFAAARNAVAAHATQPWIIRLDADEAIHDDAWLWLTEHLASLDPGIYVGVRAHNQTSARTSVDLLYPNQPSVRYEGAFHEHVNDAKKRLKRFMVPELRIETFDDRRDPTRERAKLQNYATRAAAELAGAWTARMFFHYLMALCATEQWETACNAYQEHQEQLEASKEDWSDACANIISQALLDLGRFEACVDHCERCLKRWPTSVQLLVSMGLAQEALGLGREAVVAFARALSTWDSPRPDMAVRRTHTLSPHLEVIAVRHLLFLGPIHVPEQDLSSLTRRKCLRDSERDPWLVHILLSVDRVEDAIRYLMQTATLGHGAMAGWARTLADLSTPLARALARAKVYASLPGVPFLQRAIETAHAIDPPPTDLPEWHEILGRTYVRANMLDEAIQHFEAWAELAPENPVPLALRVQALAKLQGPEAAKGALDALLERHPHDPWATQQLAQLAEP